MIRSLEKRGGGGIDDGNVFFFSINLFHFYTETKYFLSKRLQRLETIHHTYNNT